MGLICIGLCTAKRPVMLKRCLSSLAAQNAPEGHRVRLIVVDNKTEPSNQQIVAEFADACPFPVHYIHEARRGIPMARNRVLDEALKLGSDWIAFLDDDEVADCNWLSALMAPEYLETPILAGIQRWEFPEPRPFWALQREQHQEPRREGQSRATVPTNNVRISTDLMKRGLRFNDKIGLANGSDSEFFAAARGAGFAIRQTLRAITVEMAHRERLTYRYQVYRNYCTAATSTRIAISEKGRLRAAIERMPLVPAWIALGAMEVMASPMFLAGGLTPFKERALMGGKKIAKALGRLAAIAGHIPQPYAKIAGH